MEKTLEDYKDLIQKLESEGNHHEEYKVIPGYGLCALRKFMFTVGLILNIDEHSYEERYCYPYKYTIDALLAINTWNGEGYPPGRWVKRKGRVEESNPNFTNI